MSIFFILLALLGFGYRPSEFGDLSEYLSFSPRTVVSAVAAVALVVLVVAVSFSTYQYFLFGQTVNRNVNDVLAEPEYSGLELASVSAEYGAGGLFGRKGSVTVVVARSAGTIYPQLPDRLKRRITADTNRAVTVEVRFITGYRFSPQSSEPERIPK